MKYYKETTGSGKVWLYKVFDDNPDIYIYKEHKTCWSNTNCKSPMEQLIHDNPTTNIVEISKEDLILEMI